MRKLCLALCIASALTVGIAPLAQANEVVEETPVVEHHWGRGRGCGWGRGDRGRGHGGDSYYRGEGYCY